MDCSVVAAAASLQLRAWADGLTPELRVAFDAVTAGSGLHADAGAEAYLANLSQPVVLLPLWFADGLPDDVVVAVIGSALAGYLAVRLHDDWMDEARGDPTEAMLLGTALLARSSSLAGEHVSDPRWWRLHAELWQAYAEAMAFERLVVGQRVPYDLAAFQLVLRRSEPLLLPAAALLVARGRWHDVERARGLVQATVRAHQHFDDLRDALGDFREGRRTWLIAQADVGDAGAFMQWLLRGGADMALGQADAELDLALAAAADLELPAAEVWLLERRRAMWAWHGKVVGRYLAAALA
ncbi:MAG: hypothetical protein EXR79_12645 [Myxococcales bacterium]|nr:hypothetical protein [Myxococcales bacterium]